MDYHRTLPTFSCYSKRVILQIVNVYTHHDTVSCLFFILQSIITSFRLIISSRNPKSYKGVTICLCFFQYFFCWINLIFSINETYKYMVDYFVSKCRSNDRYYTCLVNLTIKKLGFQSQITIFTSFQTVAGI